MNSAGSVTVWIEKLKEGDERAAQEIFDRYYERLVAFARAKLGTLPRRSEDEEDAALSALERLFRSFSRGRYPQLQDRYEIWPLLLTITENEVSNQRKRQLAQKRGGGRTRGESAIIGPSNTDAAFGDFVEGTDLTPELLAELNERCRDLLQKLGDDSLRTVAQLRLEGYTNQEIANKLDVVERTVERKLGLIRAMWSDKRSP